MRMFYQALMIFFFSIYTPSNSYELDESTIPVINKLLQEALDKKQEALDKNQKTLAKKQDQEIINICQPLINNNETNKYKYRSNNLALGLIKYCHFLSSLSYYDDGQFKKSCDLSEEALGLLPVDYIQSGFHMRIAYCYMYETGRTRDYNKTLFHLEKAVNSNSENSHAWNALGLLYLSDEEIHPGISSLNIKNWKKASEYFIKSALISSLEGNAETSLGWMYYTGDKDFPKNYKKAFEWNSKGCENKNTNGCSNVAWSYFTGNGAKQNFNKMVSYLIKSIEYYKKEYDWILSLEDEWEKDRHLAPEYFFEARKLYWNVIRDKSETHFKKLVLMLDFDPNVSKNSGPLKEKFSNKKTQVSSGTGFSIDEDGHIVTNFHVVQGCEDIFVIYKDNKYPSKIIAFDVVNDLALIKAEKINKTYLKFSKTKPNLLSEIFVAGYPFGKNLSTSIKVTKGIVSSLSGLGNNVNQIQIDAAIQPGNSGGPILDQKGNVVGVAVAKLDVKKVIKDFGTIPENVNFGIKSTTVGNFLESNGVKFKTSGGFFKMNSNKLGDLMNASTHYISCWMSEEKVAELKSKKVFFDDIE